ncbi:Iron-sulfur cluster assembly protein, NifU-like [Desulfonema limicola]|uniref:Iron-sulfur cluster assembly protein, NifU-like n=1 Tax=Desulfonema limicola TaxID=45656 RepID=A0A975BE55_9BACT|nr:iron-sulfur cluster assembly scaffold protein [Desulfonema limicola]QTA83663.1 Iron-sulfur cluster assembly protein, NifU-like [Desulfonema limicola]
MTQNPNTILEEHSICYLEMAFRNDRHGILKNADGHGKKTGECGDTIEMFLSVENSIIENIFFQVEGCLNTNACSNAVAELAQGKTIEEAWNIITPEAISGYLESLPPDHIHCAELAAGAFYLALTDYQNIKQNPWKKAYR